MGKPTSTFIQRFQTAETQALADMLGDLASVARTSPERSAAISSAQYADCSASDEGRQELETCRMAAIEADRLLKTPGPGRPVLSDQRRRLHDLAESMSEAPEAYTSAWGAYRKIIADLKEAGPEIDKLGTMADQHSKLCQEAVQYLEQAGSTFATAADLADAGRATMGRLGNMVCFAASPFVEMQASRFELRDLARRWRLRLDAELSRLGVDPAEIESERLENAERSQGVIDLALASKQFRSTVDGRTRWATCQRAASNLAEARQSNPSADHGALHDRSQALLTEYYKQAAGLAGLPFDPAAVPTI